MNRQFCLNVAVQVTFSIDAIICLFVIFGSWLLLLLLLLLGGGGKKNRGEGVLFDFLSLLLKIHVLKPPKTRLFCVQQSVSVTS